MKNVLFSLLTTVLCVSIPVACANKGASAALTSAEAWAASPQGQQAIAEVETAATVAAAVVSGGKYQADAQKTIATVNVGLRTLQTGTAPAPAVVASTIESYGGSASVANALAPAVSGALQHALSNGVPVNDALEKISTTIDKTTVNK